MFLYIFCIKQGFLYRKNLLYLQCMKDFNIHKAKIRSLVASGYSVEQVANEFNVKYKDLKDFINKNRDVKRFWDSCENMREDVLLEQLAEHGKNKWNATVKMLEIMNPKQYSDVGIRMRAEKPDESTENEMLVNTMNVRDSIIDKHYRHFEAGHDWTLMEGGSRCFEKDTLILTANGKKKISELNANDFVLSFNHETNKKEYKRVASVIKNENNQKRCYCFRLKNGDEIKCTEDHRFYYQGRYVCAKDLVYLFDQLKNK